MKEITANNLATLFKLNHQGKLMSWTINVALFPPTIIVTFGQVGGAIQTTQDVIMEGKNTGRSNATTAEEQAMAEARARWEKQITIKGYVVDRERAERGENDRGGFEPMLAKSFDKDGAKIKWPAAAQPKLDGIRCLAIISEGGDVELVSRNGKPITAVPHIMDQLAIAFPEGGLIDGELYSHDLKENFEQLVSLVRRAKEVDEDQVLQYHIYDTYADMEFFDRSMWLKKKLTLNGSKRYFYLDYVETQVVESAEQARLVCQSFQALGYEGCMLRNLESPYENKRSFHLQKMKSFIDAEFPILRADEGRGKLAGHVGSFVCQTNEGKEFSVKLDGETSRLKDLFENQNLWQGKKITVVFQNWTKDGLPRFPVGKAIRDYE